ncbi:hypothetical protein AC623_12055 [Bacillus sp. FJAT-27231]|nr:hypothetical protein AC623_12055 [Bacillus sp. FJAT-27231]
MRTAVSRFLQEVKERLPQKSLQPPIALNERLPLFSSPVAGASAYGGFQISAEVKERLPQKSLQPPIALNERLPLFLLSSYASLPLEVISRSDYVAEERLLAISSYVCRGKAVGFAFLIANCLFFP